MGAKRKGSLMFAVLQVRPPEKGILKRGWRYLHPGKPIAVQVAVKGGAPFLCVTVSKKRGQIPWKEIGFYAGRCAGRMLLPNGLLPPADCPVKPFCPTALASLALFHTACAVLAQRHAPPEGERITLVDQTGALARRADKLLPFAALVRIVTQRPSAYQPAVKQAMEEYGAALLVQETGIGAGDSTVVIAPYGLNGDFVPAARCAVFLGGSSTCETGGVTIRAEGFDLPEAYRRLLPEGIDADRFACALYEACGLRALGEQTYTRLQLYGATTTIGGAAKMLGALHRQQKEGEQRP